ncbi:MAG: hypothetical protein ACM3VS_13870 [Candidatus Dadabacteria bacterium]
MTATVGIILDFAIYISGIIALVRFKSINPAFYPFIYCTWIGCLNETLSTILIYNGYHSLLNSNIYVLIEAILFLQFFNKLGTISRSMFQWLLVSVVLVWISENFILGSITRNSTYFRIYYSWVLVLASIHTINDLITSGTRKLETNSTFLICIGFVIYYTYKILVQAFVIYAVMQSQSFLMSIYVIMFYINFGTNLLYAVAVLWMPRKLGFSMRY